MPINSIIVLLDMQSWPPCRTIHESIHLAPDVPWALRTQSLPPTSVAEPKFRRGLAWHNYSSHYSSLASWARVMEALWWRPVRTVLSSWWWIVSMAERASCGLSQLRCFEFDSKGCCRRIVYILWLGFHFFFFFFNVFRSSVDVESSDYQSEVVLKGIRVPVYQPVLISHGH